MINLKRKGMFVSFLLLSILVSCGPSEEEKAEAQRLEEELAYYEDMAEGDAPYEITNPYNHVQMIVDSGPEGIFYTVPLYYQQEFKNVVIGDLNVAENGNLITCLSMLDSFYSADYVTPDLFIEKYGTYIDENGRYDKDKLISAVAEENSRVVTIEDLDVLKLPTYILDYKLKVLVHINHTSIFGESSAYIIITDITDDGQLVIRDPNQENINSYATVMPNGETIYNTFDFFFAAGRDAKVYIIGGGTYEFETEKEYTDIEELDYPE